MLSGTEFSRYLDEVDDLDLYLIIVQGLLAQAKLAGHRSTKLYPPQPGAWTPRFLKMLQDSLLADGYRVGYHKETGWPSEQREHFTITAPKA